MNIAAHLRSISPDRDLSQCASCLSQLVEPTRWEAAGPEAWHIWLWCPNCLGSTDGLFSQACAECFDAKLDAAAELMITEVLHQEQARMEAFCQRFAGAIHAGAILPEDFDASAR